MAIVTGAELPPKGSVIGAGSKAQCDECTRTKSENKKIKKFYRGAGCHKCRETGFSGRIGVFEVFSINERISSMISSGVSKEELNQAALENGMVPLIYSALNRVKNGETTLEEIIKHGIISK